MQRPYIEDIIRWKIKLHLRQLTEEEDDEGATCAGEYLRDGKCLGKLLSAKFLERLYAPRKFVKFSIDW